MEQIQRITSSLIHNYSDIADCLAEEFLAPNDKQLILESTVSTVVWGDEY